MTPVTDEKEGIKASDDVNYQEKILEQEGLEQKRVPEPDISNEHKEYLLSRHGTLDLHPLPSADPNEPLNWPLWKKNTLLLMVAFQTMMVNFSGSALIPGFENLALLYNVSLNKASYLTTSQIVVAGVIPLFWNPISARYGRRPVFLVSTIGTLICNIGGARCYSYGTQLTTRILMTIFICPPIGFGTAIVTEMYFSHEIARRMGWWTLMLTIGTPAGPFIMGFVVQRVGVLWIFWILAIVNFFQFLGYFLLNAETRYIRPESTSCEPTRPTGRFVYRRIDHTPWSLREFLSPFLMSRFLTVIIPICAYSVVYGYANVAVLIEMAQVMGEKFHLDAQATGLQFLAVIIGSTIGGQISGPLSDFMLGRHARRTGKVDPTYRLWVSYSGFAGAIAGLLVWGIRIQQATTGVWNVTPAVGAGIANFGFQIVNNTLITFVVERHRQQSGQIGVLFNFIRQIWAFIGPFYFPDMFSTLNYGGTAGVMCGLIVVFGVLPTALVHFKGMQWN